MRVGLIGGDFQHAHSTTLWKHPSYFTWDKGNRQDITFFIDGSILDNIDTKVPEKYGWLVESRVIMPNVISQFKEHYKEISQSYKYVFTHYKEIYDLADNFIYMPPHGYWIEKPAIYPKTKMASLISSDKRFSGGHLHRLNWVDKLKDKVDVFGRNIRTFDRKEDALCDYHFGITIENDQYETYWTEKILDCFVSGTIPVYHGAPDLGNYFNMGGVVALNDGFDPSQLSIDLYYSMKDAMMDNFERALKFNVIEDIIYESYLK